MYDNSELLKEIKVFCGDIQIWDLIFIIWNKSLFK